MPPSGFLPKTRKTHFLPRKPPNFHFFTPETLEISTFLPLRNPPNRKNPKTLENHPFFSKSYCKKSVSKVIGFFWKNPPQKTGKFDPQNCILLRSDPKNPRKTAVFLRFHRSLTILDPRHGAKIDVFFWFFSSPQTWYFSLFKKCHFPTWKFVFLTSKILREKVPLPFEDLSSFFLKICRSVVNIYIRGVPTDFWER